MVKLRLASEGGAPWRWWVSDVWDLGLQGWSSCLWAGAVLAAKRVHPVTGHEAHNHLGLSGLGVGSSGRQGQDPQHGWPCISSPVHLSTEHRGRSGFCKPPRSWLSCLQALVTVI